MKLNRPYVLGLTGGIACGKSYVARLLRQRGIPVLDADAISRALTADGGAALPAVRAAFGDQVFDGDTLNRRALGEVVFADPAARKRLEGILHPLIISRMQRETEASGAPLVAWDVPLLYETGMDAQCDEVWCVSIAPRNAAGSPVPPTGTAPHGKPAAAGREAPPRRPCDRYVGQFPQHQPPRAGAAAQYAKEKLF